MNKVTTKRLIHIYTFVHKIRCNLTINANDKPALDTGTSAPNMQTHVP